MRNKLNELKKEFESNKQLNSIEFEIGKPANFEAKNPWFTSVKKEIGKDIKATFENVLRDLDHLKIVTKNSHEAVINEVTFDGTLTAFNDFAQEHYIHAFDEFGEVFKTFARQFYPIDIYHESQQETTLTVMKPAEENQPAEFWIWNNAGPKYKLKLDNFEAYLNAGIACKFVVFWQYFFVDTDALNLTEPFTSEWIAPDYKSATERMRLSLDTLNNYFPIEDWSKMEQAFEDIKTIS